MAELALAGYGTVEYLYENCSSELLGFFYDKLKKTETQKRLDDLVIARHAHHADKKAMDKLVSQLRRVLDGNKKMSPEEFLAKIKKAFGG